MQTAILCSICNSDQTVTDPESGEIICRNCGLVLSDRGQESRPEWRAFTSEEVNDRSRTGIPRSLARHDMGLSTVIGRTDKDASGHMLDGAMRSTMGRLRAWDFRTQRSEEHTSELQSRQYLVCRLLLEKKKEHI